MELSLEWLIIGSGWAKLTFRLGEESFEVITSYLCDGLGSVVQAAVDLQGGSSSAVAFLADEPAGTYLFFSGADQADGMGYLRAVTFADWMSRENPWANGRWRWHGRIPVEAFVRAVLGMADEAAARWNPAGYEAAWGGGSFPAEQVERLRAALA
ncbi:hypothetical protein [Kineosporia babensis]|uniref:Uncharacterized protein n=1 Tax=Kineosporia babensis TaxID=499548 RepID=A0A9X1SY56_9ACTN|nr:hypothetical protein [Kineosporia babensis]MCD5316524.1 hypothetical protein [Kineosporia babensis]